MRRFLVLVVLLAACGSSTATTAPPGTPETTAPTTTGPGADEALFDQAVAIVEEPSELAIALFARQAGGSGDPAWIPYLVDLTRLAGTPDAFGALQGALQVLTGEQGPDEAVDTYRFFGSWMYRNAVDPGERYIEWKAGLYALIDPAFEELIAQVDDPVLAGRLQWGGVLRGGIRALDHQPPIPVADAEYMQPDELTFGAVIEGEARAYPHRVLDHHELANDTLGGQPVALANCTLCRTGVLFSRQVGGRVLDFQTSGLLLNSNKVMVDIQTDTLWEQLSGVAIAGPLRGTVLDRFFLTVTTWGAWVAEHPDTDVLSIPNGPYSYEPGDAYRSYYDGDDLWFPTFESGAAFDPKDEMATLDLDGSTLAVGVEALAAAGPQLLEVAGRTVAVLPTAGGARFYDVTDAAPSGLDGAVAGDAELTLSDGSVSPRLQSGQSFWFAWYGSHPDTAWWPAG